MDGIGRVASGTKTEQLPTTAWMQEVEQCRSNCRDVLPFAITQAIENDAMKNKQKTKMTCLCFRALRTPGWRYSELP